MKNIGMMSALLAGGAAFAADGIKMGGFIDAGWNWTKTGSGAANTTNGFAFNDGAIYLGKTMGMGEATLDMPLSLMAANATYGDNFLIAGTKKAQAYVTWKYDNGFNWKIGQFDYVLPFEAADSANRLMASAGKLGELFGAMTHLGATVGYSLSDTMGVNLVFANKNGVTQDKFYNQGLTFNMTSDAFRFNTGFIMNHGGAWEFDLNAGTKAGSIDLDFEAAFTSSGVDGSDMNMGFMALANFEINETMGFGVRAEYVKNYELTADPTDAADARDTTQTGTMAFAAGPHFEMSKDLTVRLDFDYSKADTDGADPEMGLMLSAVHKF